MWKLVSVAGFAGSMLLSVGTPAFAQAGSPNSCQYFKQSNPRLYAQLCVEESEFPEFDSPILGDDSEPEVVYCDALAPERFPLGARVRVAAIGCPS
jgi:hypothetical protein